MQLVFLNYFFRFLPMHSAVITKVCSEDLKMSALPADHRKFLGEMDEEVPCNFCSYLAMLWSLSTVAACSLDMHQSDQIPETQV